MKYSIDKTFSGKLIMIMWLAQEAPTQEIKDYLRDQHMAILESWWQQDEEKYGMGFDPAKTRKALDCFQGAAEKCFRFEE